MMLKINYVFIITCNKHHHIRQVITHKLAGYKQPIFHLLKNKCNVDNLLKPKSEVNILILTIKLPIINHKKLYY